jgi:hypothetical protein
MPASKDIGYNFGRDYYNNLGLTSREDYDRAQIRILTGFFLGEIRLGRTGCRFLVTGVNPIDHWPRYLQGAARAANLIAMSFGYTHYDVTIPSFDEEALVTPYSFTTPERTFTNPIRDVPSIPPTERIKNCHPAAFFYNLSLQMGSRFAAALSMYSRIYSTAQRSLCTQELLRIT